MQKSFDAFTYLKSIGLNFSIVGGIDLKVRPKNKINRQELKYAGWTAGELYRRNKSKGIVWLYQWSNGPYKALQSLLRRRTVQPVLWGAPGAVRC